MVQLILVKGEICVASSRVYVQEGIYDDLVKKLVEKAKAWAVGDPFDPQVRQGPQVISYIHTNRHIDIPIENSNFKLRELRSCTISVFR